MPASGAAKPDAAAVRAALLTYYDDRNGLITRTLVTATRLQRLKLTWLAHFLLAGSAFRTGERLGRGEVPESVHTVTRCYAELSGQDSAAARQDVDRMVDQLEVFAPPELALLAPNTPIGLLTRAELLLIADAPVKLALANWQTADPLLTDVQASYVAMIELRDEVASRPVEPTLRSLRATVHHTKATEPIRAAARQRCCEAWIRWLDQQPRR